MTFGSWRLRRLLRGSGTMLGQIRTLFLALCLGWPLIGLWAVHDTESPAGTAALVAAIVVVDVSLLIGYRREHFPAWAWLIEGAGVVTVAASSHFGTTISLLFLWVNFRVLYGRLTHQLIGVTAVVTIMLVGAVLFGRPVETVLSMTFTAFASMTVNYLLARGSSARDRAAYRERVLASAGAGLVTATTREEATDIMMGAALSMDPDVTAALVTTVAGPAVQVVGAAGHVGPDATGWITGVDSLPADVRAAVQPGGFALLTQQNAAALTRALRMEPHPAIVVAPLTARGEVFGLLVLTFGKRPIDDLSAAVTTLADQTALTFDQLLSRSRLDIVVNHSPDALVLANEEGVIRFVNPAAERLLTCPAVDLIGRNIQCLVHADDLADLLASTPLRAQVCRIRGQDDVPWSDVEAIVEYVSEHDGSRSIVFNARDISERLRLELELRHAQKLESVGRLAAGIAHEINTPIQFVGDNTRFLDSAFADLRRIHLLQRELVVAVGQGGEHAPLAQRIGATAEEIDVEFVLEEVPVAVNQMLDGINRVATIVRAMKAFGHPGTEDKAEADLNEAISNTLVVADNEIKFVADVVTDLADLPPVRCHVGDINQVVLNLVVNAAHAITAAGRGRGRITVTTRLADDHVAIAVADTGTGIAPRIADKLFDPFFTTKEVGVGTGQGLALVRTLVVDRHGGAIDFSSELGTGTTFTVRLPVGRPDLSPAGRETTRVRA